MKKSSILLWLLLALFYSIESVAQPTRSKVLFNNNWKFYKGDIANAETKGFNDHNWRTLNLPHDWSAEGPFDSKWASATAFLPGGVGWYRKVFNLPADMKEKKVFVYFDGVYNNSEVWINGHLLGKRPNGFIAFQYDLTPYLSKGNNLIAVRANHSKFADSRWYTGSGIYRNVYLIATNPVHVGLWGTAFTNEGSQGKITVSVDNTSATRQNVLVKTALYDAAGKLAAQNSNSISIAKVAQGKLSLSLRVPNATLWSVDQPYLYKMQTSVYLGAKKVDEYTEKVGFKTIKFDADNGFFLNAKNLKIKGVCLHDDAGVLGVAVPKEVWRRRLLLLKAAGVNSVRMSHNPHADYFYDLCDELGLLVMDEAFDEWEYGKNKWIAGWNVGKPGQDGYHEYFKEWGERDLTDMVKRDRNHASIFMWSIGNEIDYPNDPYSAPVLSTGRNPQIYGRGYLPDHPAATALGEISARLVRAVKQIDVSRPVTAALAGVAMSNTTTYPQNLDVVGYNYQEYRYDEDHKQYPGRIIYGSENGMKAGYWAVVDSNKYISAQYLWTGIDYMGEAHKWPEHANGAGLLDMAGFPKAEYYFRQSIWTNKPMIYIGASRPASNGDNSIWAQKDAQPIWNWTKEEKVVVSCFSNCDEAELFLNGKSLGRKAVKDHTLTWSIAYQEGTLTAKGYKNAKVAATYAISTAGEPYTIKVHKFESASVVKPELTHLEIQIVDAKGVPISTATNNITVIVTGPAKLLALESGSLTSTESYNTDTRKAVNGKLLAYIKYSSTTGKVNVKVSGQGLKDQIIAL
ncbi:DUF4982 domain-containing protein [Mucilaginibacter terrenus]|uniref:DUF4982 domain-containing protein n=1 Tax=Mucilaginibacter terrenus TaxID=2482727 RepID=A0A3E2NTR3_9SPHI|nr:sugar-binding domain-containing protein [Mucilaginibacter terrenus]RFZ84396.1 DUF4982 domain-containing protein [Mucilaginibacter terrenus]